MHFSFVTRESPLVKSSQDYNVAVRFPEKVIYNVYNIYSCKIISLLHILIDFVDVYFKGSEVKYLTLHDLNEVFDILTNQEKGEDDENVEETEDYEEAYYGSSLMKMLNITNKLKQRK